MRITQHYPVFERGTFFKILKNWGLLALGVILATNTSEGISYDHNSALFLAVIILSFLNLVFKPLLLIFTLPFVILTMGIGVWIINAVLFLLASQMVTGFTVESFSSALWGAFVVSLTSIVANKLLKSKRNPLEQPQESRHSNDIIDI